MAWMGHKVLDILKVDPTALYVAGADFMILKRPIPVAVRSRLMSAASHLLGLRIRILPGAWITVL
jgi:hypothetical protein